MPEFDDGLAWLMAQPGVLGVSVIDRFSGTTISAIGHVHTERFASGVSGTIDAALRAAAFAVIGQPESIEDIVITASSGYHLLYPMAAETDGRLVLYLWLDRVVGNLAVVRRHVQAFAATLHPVLR